jgi:hypothetical protein
LVLVKGDRRTGSQVSPTTQILVLVQGDRLMGSQVKKKKGKENEKERKKERRRKKKRKKHLEFFFTKLTMQNIEEFGFVSIVKRGHRLLPNF